MKKELFGCSMSRLDLYCEENETVGSKKYETGSASRF